MRGSSSEVEVLGRAVGRGVVPEHDLARRVAGAREHVLDALAAADATRLCVEHDERDRGASGLMPGSRSGLGVRRAERAAGTTRATPRASGSRAGGCRWPRRGSAWRRRAARRPRGRAARRRRVRLRAASRERAVAPARGTTSTAELKKPTLGRSITSVGHDAARGLLEHVLRRQPAHLQLGRDRRAQLDEPVIEERARDLERVRHRRAVEVVEHVVDERRAARRGRASP